MCVRARARACVRVCEMCNKLCICLPAYTFMRTKFQPGDDAVHTDVFKEKMSKKNCVFIIYGCTHVCEVLKP